MCIRDSGEPPARALLRRAVAAARPRRAARPSYRGGGGGGPLVKATIAQYYAGDSLLHRLDPRAKFVAVSALAVALFVRDSFAGLAVYAAQHVLAYVLSGLK